MSGPPYDGKQCPCCPGEVRDLYATAVKVINAMAHHDVAGARAAMREMSAAVDAMEPLLDKHFENKAHAFPSDIDPSN